MQYGILGSLELRVEGRRVEPTRPRVQAALALFLLNSGELVTIDALIDGLWGEDPPKTARAQVHTVVSEVRRLLPAPDHVARESAGYRLNLQQGVLDSARFELLVTEAQRHLCSAERERAVGLLREALALWRGEALSGIGAPFADAARARLREQRFRAHMMVADAELAGGDCSALIPELSALSAEFPEREDVAERLARALYFAGRQTEALAVLRTVRALLAEDYGVDPGRELVALEGAMLRGDLVREASPGVRPSPGAHQPPQGVTPSGPAPFGPTAAPPPAPTGPLPSGSVPAEPTPPGAAAAPGVTRAVLAPSGSAPPASAEGQVASAPSPGSPVLRQLPHDLPDFIGREKEMATLLETGAADRSPCSAPRVVVVSGMGGVGKTALVLHAAHRLAAAFPGGQLYVDLRGFGAGDPRTPFDVLGRFLMDLGVSGRSLPEDVDDRAALYRAVLADRQVLIVLDNARDTHQIGPLLPGNGSSAVLVTSRRALAGPHGATRVALHPMAEDEQHRMLERLCGEDALRADPESASLVLDACAGLPLALRIAGAQLATRPTWSLSTLARRLSCSGSRLRALAVDHLAVHDTFVLSYNGLRDSGQPMEREAAQAFRLLGLWPSHPVAPEAAAALLGESLADTADVLDLLADTHLLQATDTGGYRFHDLVGEFAEQCALTEEPEAEREAALLRLVTWYSAAAHRANSLTAPVVHFSPPRAAAPLPDFHDGRDALAWFVREMPALKAVIELAGRTARPELAWRTANAMLGYGHAYWWVGEWTQCLTKAMDWARRHDDLMGQAYLHNALGAANGMAYRNDECLAHLRAALALHRETENGDGQATVLGNLALVHRQAGRLQEAIAALEESRLLRLRLGHTQDSAIILSSKGLLLRDSGDAAAALEAYAQALEIFRSQGLDKFVAGGLFNTAECFRALGRSAEAFEAYAESLTLARKMDDQDAVADILHGTAQMHHEVGDLEQARVHWEEARAIAREHGLQKVLEESAEALASLGEDSGLEP
ncbi:AfsR/SARP family transcriptional regulator [Streptomyces triticiradicis]|uniref:AfsR/SARP family transcriptional regulator n=1 Tax=Streptomyces triticiradicis TaxID=2651189 RepID=UPI001788ACD4|nr:BTAD domain-containing putative transcriptional regulator [Streptomyces triticiradicis]